MAARKAQKGAGTVQQKTQSSRKKATAGAPHSKATRRTAATSKPSVTLTHEQIAERAEALWLQKGCQPGQDEQNWREAEAQLKAELGLA